MPKAKQKSNKYEEAIDLLTADLQRIQADFVNFKDSGRCQQIARCPNRKRTSRFGFAARFR